PGGGGPGYARRSARPSRRGGGGRGGGDGREGGTRERGRWGGWGGGGGARGGGGGGGRGRGRRPGPTRPRRPQPQRQGSGARLRGRAAVGCAGALPPVVPYPRGPAYSCGATRGVRSVPARRHPRCARRHDGGRYEAAPRRSFPGRAARRPSSRSPRDASSTP